MYYRPISSVAAAENTCTIKSVLADCCCRITEVPQKTGAVMATVMLRKWSGQHLVTDRAEYDCLLYLITMRIY